MTFAQRTKELMKQKGISQNELARKAGLSSSGISTTLSENGNPRESSMVSIYNAFGMTPEEFWTDRRFAEPLSSNQQQILFIFDQMNQDGQNNLIVIANALLSDPRNRKESSMSSAV